MHSERRALYHVQDVPCGSHIETDSPIEGHTRFHFRVSVRAVTQFLTAFSCFTMLLAWLYFVVDSKLPHYGFARKCTDVPNKFLYKEGLPSLLKLGQLRAFPNYMMRLGILPTMLVRIFLIFSARWRKHVTEPESTSKTGFRNMLHDLLPALHAVEVFSLAMILILHCKFDHIGFYSVYAMCFTASSLAVMAVTVYLNMMKPGGQLTETDQKSLTIGLICLVLYGASAPLVMDNHLDFAKFFTCSYLVPYTYFALELISFVSYGAFHYYHGVIDIGDLEMCCYADAQDLPDEFSEFTSKTSHCMRCSEKANTSPLSCRTVSSIERNSKERMTM
ncbi:hypothetical protein QR680_010916 [Steinernema hermaphroditum]|uniref:Uncharacterized protein n=1 Tax=Steinernema hermaphroditum TaxID=289476 RepID=A0AA39MCL1_9BILA|nr:hypothetical protein QR680_010916 [Steinernema hermaphroditum]